jgi:hypothetical protein
MERGYELVLVLNTQHSLSSSERLIGDENETGLAPMARPVLRRGVEFNIIFHQ